MGTICPRVTGLDGSRLHTGAMRLGGCVSSSTTRRRGGVRRLGNAVRAARLRSHRNVFTRVSGLRGRILRGCRGTLSSMLPRTFTVMGSATHHFSRGPRLIMATASFSHRLTTRKGSFIHVRSSGTV